MVLKRNFLAELLTLTLITGCGFTKFGSRSGSNSVVGDDGEETQSGDVYSDSSDEGTDGNNGGGDSGDNLEQLKNPGGNGSGSESGMESVENNNGTPQEQIWQQYGIGLKSARNIYDTMVTASGIPADDPAITAAFESYAGSLTIEDKNRTLTLSAGQIAAMVNLDRAFCQRVATDATLRTSMYGTGVDFAKAPSALSAQEKQELVNPWVSKLWQDGRVGAVPDGQAQSLYASVNKMAAEIANPAAAASTIQLATASCVMVAIAFQTFEN